VMGLWVRGGLFYGGLKLRECGGFVHGWRWPSAMAFGGI
jgi:hypothetical protein